ncbi:MAG: flagellar export chaperone FliS [Geminicoccaceae bacterium]
MMTPARHYRAATCYRDALQTQTPARQITALYDAAIARLKEARLAIEEGRIEDRFHAVTKAINILHGLQSCLDFTAGGAMAAMLDRFYAHALNRMFQISATNDPQLCDELVTYLAPMRESWAKIAEGNLTGAAPPPAQHLAANLST